MPSAVRRLAGGSELRAVWENQLGGLTSGVPGGTFRHFRQVDAPSVLHQSPRRGGKAALGDRLLRQCLGSSSAARMTQEAGSSPTRWRGSRR